MYILMNSSSDCILSFDSWASVRHLMGKWRRPLLMTSFLFPTTQRQVLILFFKNVFLTNNCKKEKSSVSGWWEGSSSALSPSALRDPFFQLEETSTLTKCYLHMHKALAHNHPPIPAHPNCLTTPRLSPSHPPPMAHCPAPQIPDPFLSYLGNGFLNEKPVLFWALLSVFHVQPTSLNAPPFIPYVQVAFNYLCCLNMVSVWWSQVDQLFSAEAISTCASLIVELRCGKCSVKLCQAGGSLQCLEILVTTSVFFHLCRDIVGKM